MSYADRMLIVGILVLPVSCTGSHADGPQGIIARAQPAATSVIADELVDRANNTGRDEWYSAVEHLAALARVDEKTRAIVWSRAMVNRLGMKFVGIKPGTFVMGPSPMPWGKEWGEIAHGVEITKGFFISVSEVSNAQFALLFPDHAPHLRSPSSDTPVVGVTWQQAVRFCELLSEREAVRYRLPTEAEWEYACRAGTATAFCFGDDPALLGEYAWYGKYHDDAAPVASFKPNAWGIYDMHGNALEWTSDWYRVDTYRRRVAAEAVIRDPQGPTSGSGHLLRGGYWACWEPLALASSKRTRMPILPLYIEIFDPQFLRTREATGFRVVRERDE